MSIKTLLNLALQNAAVQAALRLQATATIHLDTSKGPWPVLIHQGQITVVFGETTWTGDLVDAAFYAVSSLRS